MARGASGKRTRQREEKERRLTETLDVVISDPPYLDGFDISAPREGLVSGEETHPASFQRARGPLRNARRHGRSER
jgi:hypothetical protein